MVPSCPMCHMPLVSIRLGATTAAGTAAEAAKSGVVHFWCFPNAKQTARKHLGYERVTLTRNFVTACITSQSVHFCPAQDGPGREREREREKQTDRDRGRDRDRDRDRQTEQTQTQTQTPTPTPTDRHRGLSSEGEADIFIIYLFLISQGARYAGHPGRHRRHSGQESGNNYGCWGCDRLAYQYMSVAHGRPAKSALPALPVACKSCWQS